MHLFLKSVVSIPDLSSEYLMILRNYSAQHYDTVWFRFAFSIVNQPNLSL